MKPKRNPVETPRWGVSDVSAERLYGVSDWGVSIWDAARDQRSAYAMPGFKCLHCRNQVVAESLFSGVVNRNHCPYCLHSRHLDLHRPGDRLAACKAPMAPIGLTMKRSRKKYGLERGELMLIHRCAECGKVSLNRIAADDDNGRLLDVFQASFDLEPRLRAMLKAEKIDLLDAGDLGSVEQQLFGGQPALAGEFFDPLL